MTEDEIKGVRGLLFDKDGTLFGFQESWAPPFARLLAGFAEAGADPRALAGAAGFDLDRGQFAPHSPVIAGTLDEVSALLDPHLPGMGRRALEARLDAWAAEAELAPVTDLAALAARLTGAGLTLGVATNDTEAAARIHCAPIAAHLSYLAGYDSGHGAKPGPGMVQGFLAATGLAPAEVAMFGDSLHDLQAARAAEVRAVAVLTGVAGRDALAPHADHVLASIAEIPGWLRVP